MSMPSLFLLVPISRWVIWVQLQHNLHPRMPMVFISLLRTTVNYLKYKKLTSSLVQTRDRSQQPCIWLRLITIH